MNAASNRTTVFSRRILVGSVALVLLGLMRESPAARQVCEPQGITRLGGTISNQTSRAPSLSGNGRYVAFHSSADLDLDGDFTTDVYVYDRNTCALERASESSTGVKGNFRSEWASVSDDGRFVAFTSEASTLVTADGNGPSRDAFLRDRQLGLTTVISLDSAGNQPATESAAFVRLSGNGQVIAFLSVASTLVEGDTNNESDVFVRDLVSGLTERVSISTAGVQGDSPVTLGVSEPVLSEDGRFVAFMSSMNTLVPDDFNNGNDVFVRDRLLNTTVRASVRSDGAEVTGANFSGPTITGDGRFVFFGSLQNMVPGNTACDGIFVRDLVLETTSCPALDPANLNPSQSSYRPSVSSDGRYVAFANPASYHVAGDSGFASDTFVHDRATGGTQRASVSAAGVEGSSSSDTSIELSADGQVVAFDSFARNLVPFDTNAATDVFVAAWTMLPSTPHADQVRNGSFGSGLQHWQTFATPDPSYIVTTTAGGELQFYRVPPPPGTTNQAVVFQNTWAQLLANSPVEARFRLGNGSSVRKRISVLVHDADFSDLAVCTFWLDANAPMRDYAMRTHTTELWSNATISFYAATPGSNGGFYRVDNVAFIYQPTFDDDVVDCVDPTAPVAPGGAPGPTLLTNGDFSAGLTPWTTFGQITWQIANSVFEFFRPAGTPAGVVLQPTGQPIADDTILTALIYLGNSSNVRKRATVILHDNDFSDLAACTFWMPPQLPLSPFFVRTFATRSWANATLSVYPSTVGTDEWIRLTDATLQVTPGIAPLGTECIEPGANQAVLIDRGFSRMGLVSQASRSAAAPAGRPDGTTAKLITGVDLVHSGPQTIWQGIVDARHTHDAALTFQVTNGGEDSRAVAQVSLDGTDWITLAILPTSADWRSMVLDLSALSGGLVHVRLVSELPGPWRVRNVRLNRRQLP